MIHRVSQGFIQELRSEWSRIDFFSPPFCLLFVDRKHNQTEPSQARPGHTRGKQTGPDYAAQTGACVRVGACRLDVRRTQEVERVRRGARSAHTKAFAYVHLCVFTLCVYVFVCVGLRMAPGWLCLRVFPCVSDYYSVGGHTEARGDV